MREKLVINGELLNTTTQTDYCMKKLITYLSCLLMVMLACTSLTSCSDDDEPGKIELAKGESSKVSVAANTSSGSIKFTAAAPWSAYTSAQSRSSDGVDWIHLNTTSGSAGEVSLTFTLDRNTTGSNRTAYIIIICDGETLTITITQTTETDPDEGDYASPGSGSIIIEVQSYSNDNVSDIFYTTYHFEYQSDLPYRLVAEWRDDIDPGPNPSADHDSYCLNYETTYFTWNGSNRNNISSVKVTSQDRVTYYPTERTEIEDQSEHYAEFKDGRAVKGWYKWDDEDRADWEATYDNAGYLASTKNNDGTSIWDTYTYSWKDGCLEKIVWTGDKRVVFTYADSSLKNLHSTFDLNWVLPTELECYDFAAGDITRMFAITGLMGNPSRLLLTAITEYESDNRTYSYRMNYKENTSARTVVTVMKFVDDVQYGYKEWTIDYYNIK
jgi:hypothetical protein